jgi:hypothetical protein
VSGPNFPDGGIGQKSVGNVRIQSYWLKTPDFYEIGQERQRHADAIYAYGEYDIFVLLWNAFDYGAGLVQHCPQCYSTNDGISDTYNQPSYTKCSLCYGTTFFLLSAGINGVGGVKARLVRPGLWTPSDQSQKQTASGQVTSGVAQVQSVSDFRMRTGDVVMRADSTRWRVASHNTQSIISGFQPGNDIRAMTGYNYGQAVREDLSMPAYIIPVGPGNAAGDQAALLGTNTQPNWPVDFSAYEIVNGPLIADDFANTQPNNPVPPEGN